MSELWFDLQLFATAAVISNAAESLTADNIEVTVPSGSKATDGTETYTVASGAKIAVAAESVVVNASDGGVEVTIVGGNAEVNATGDAASKVVIKGNGSNVQTGAGSDTIMIGSNDSSIIAGDGNNVVVIGATTSVGSGAQVSVGGGNDTINVYATDATIEAGDGNNNIDVVGNYAAITAGSGNDVITLSNSSDSTIDAGAGNNDITLRTVTSSFVTFGDGKTTITGLGAYNTSGTYNVVETSNTDLYGNVTTDGSNLSLKDDDGNRLYLSGITTDTAFAWNDGNTEQVIKVGATKANNTFTYDANVTQYWGGSKSDTLVASKTSDNVSVWLDGTNVLTNESTGIHYTSMDVVDLSKVSGNVTLAGTANSETLIGGTGGGSIWGGFGDGDDLLVAGKKSTLTLVGGMGQGNDTMTAYSTNTIKLWNVNVSDVTSFDKGDANTIVLGFSDGKTLTVGLMESSGTYTFEAANGEQWQSKYDSSTKTRSWSKV